MTVGHVGTEHRLVAAQSTLLEAPPDTPMTECAVVERAAPRPGGPRWIRPVGAAAATVIILIALGGVLEAVSDSMRRDAGRVNAPTTTMHAPSTATPRAPSTAPGVVGSFDTVLSADMLSSGWERLESPLRVDLMTEWSGGFVAYGSIAVDPQTDTSESAIGLFSSDDGLAWTRTTDAAQNLGNVVALATAGDGIVALAEGTIVSRHSAVPGAARWGGALEVEEVFVWRSADGRTWTRVPLGIGTILDPENRAPWVGYDPAGLATSGSLAVAAVTEHPDDSPARLRTLVFVSDNGTAWNRSTVGSLFSGAEVNALTGHPGGFVFIGNRLGDPTIWWSSDGLSWRSAMTTALGFGPEARPTSLVSTPHGLVAAGSRSGRPAIWISSDGMRWHNAAMEVASGTAHISRVVAVGPNVFAFGENRDASRRLCWISTDGINWDRVDLDPADFAPTNRDGSVDDSPAPIGYFYGVDDALVATGEATWIWRTGSVS